MLGDVHCQNQYSSHICLDFLLNESTQTSLPLGIVTPLFYFNSSYTDNCQRNAKFELHMNAQTPSHFKVRHSPFLFHVSLSTNLDDPILTNIFNLEFQDLFEDSTVFLKYHNKSIVLILCIGVLCV